ncbi:MAG: glycosyltransferase family 2 protein [Clostridiales bacterium]|nr:glycosyltransferase family 2 protein [Clostridiales bacterium]
MDTKKVKVLLSAYNGERYIEEQADSILAQSYPDIELIIRDDGSSDGTLQVLEKYRDDPRVSVRTGTNMGFIRSFLDLIAHSGDADYYAFADQDDVWLSDKIQMAVERLEKEPADKPLLYFSNYDFYDQDMNFKEHAALPSMDPSFHNAIVDCITLGFNSVFNRTAREMVVSEMPEHACGHDWWMYMLCSAMGKVVFDERVTVKYRRHEKNVSPGGKDFIRFQIWRFKKFFVNDYFRNVRMQLQEFYGYYRDSLSEEDRKLLYLFSRPRYNFITAVRKAFYPGRYRCGNLDEFFVRVLCLIGKL